MRNEGPYGGKIVVKADGSVEWQAAGRSFPHLQDTEGVLEYAIRMTTADRAIITSSDNKCIVHIHPAPGQGFNVTTGAKSAMLIVSGYESPPEEAGAVVIGKSYFVTGGFHNADGKHSDVAPCYDVHLKYDQYDVDRANTQIAHLGKEVNERALTFCYQRFSLVHGEHEDSWISSWNQVQFDSSSHCNDHQSGAGTTRHSDPVNESQSDPKPGKGDPLSDADFIVSGNPVDKIVGSRTLIVKGIERPGTFAVMYHWQHDDHDGHDREASEE